MPFTLPMPEPFADHAVVRASVGYTRSVHEPLEVFSTSVALGYGLGAGVVPELELFVEAPRGTKDEVPARTLGGGGSLNMRWYALRSEPLSAWTEWGVGPVVYGAPFPPGGSQINFSSHVGVGLAPRIHGHSAQVGVNFRHVSNAGLFGEGNPGLDAVLVSVGWATPW